MMSSALGPLFGVEGFWRSFAAIMSAALMLVAVGLVVGPREPVRFLDAGHLRAHLWWGAGFIAIGGLAWLLRSDELRYGGAGLACLGVVYLVAGMIGSDRRMMKSRGSGSE